MRTINLIVVHCTATFPDQRVTIEDITRWHKQRGFKTIGYHYLITQDGEIHEGRPIEDAGAHCKNFNAHSIGVCYAGGLAADGTPADTRTTAQKESLVHLLKELKQRFPEASIHGHRDFANKACPCFNATTEYAEL